MIKSYSSQPDFYVSNSKGSLVPKALFLFPRGKDPAWEQGYSSIATGTHKYNYKTLLVNEPTGCESLPSQLVVLSTTACGMLFDWWLHLWLLFKENSKAQRFSLDGMSPDSPCLCNISTLRKTELDSCPTDPGVLLPRFGSHLAERY